MPRPDSPSVFGAILDRGAGHFRLGPYGVSVPAARRYLPGSLILETTWQTHTGWLIVRDALVMGPWHDLETRSRTHRRTPMDWDAEHILLRTVRCVSGTVELVMSCEPSFDYHRVSADWEYSAQAYGEAIARATQGPGFPSDAAADHQPAHRPGGPRSARPDPAQRGRQRVRRAELVAGTRRRRPIEEAADKMWKTSECWRQWINVGDFPDHPVAGLPAAQRADAQGPDLLADRRAAGRRRPRRCRRPRRANATGTTATPGCATRRSRCGASTRSAWTARPTTSSPSSPTCPAPTTASGIRCR